MIQNFEENSFQNQNNDMGTENRYQDYSNNIPVFNSFSEIILKQKRQKKEIRRLSYITGIPFLILILFSVFWVTILLFFTDFAGISRQTIASFLQGKVNQDCISIFISTFIFILFFSVPLKISGKRISDIVAFEKPKKGTLLPLFVIGIAFCMFANLLTLVFDNFFESFGTEYSIGSTQVEFTFISTLLTVISTAVIPALVEEFACRGVVLGTLLPYGEGFAVLTSAIVFGVMHGNFEQMPFAFLVGLVLGYVRVKSGSVWPCVLIHFSNNLFSVINEYADKMFSGETVQFFFVLFVVIALVAGILAIFSISKDENALTFDKGDSDIEEKNKYKWYFTSPVLIIAIVIYFLVSFRYFV